MSARVIRKLIRTDGSTMDLPAPTKFGRWTVVGRASPRETRSGIRRSVLRVRCACGTEREVLQQHLRNGDSKSCGCLHKEVQAARFKAMATTHGLTRTGSWNSWVAMNARCQNPKHEDFKHYGGRGITVCARWGSFANFYDDMGERPEGRSIDRVDTNGNYEPGNCRWATQQEQCINRRGITQHSFNGESHTVREWSERLGVPISRIKYRIKYQRPICGDVVVVPDEDFE